MKVQSSAGAAREEKPDALQGKLVKSVGALVTGEDWKRALAFSARFRSRNFNNSMLIATAHYSAYIEGRVPEPLPTYIAGFRQWQSLGRHVVKGQSRYGILAPVTARFTSRTPRFMAPAWSRREARPWRGGEGAADWS